MGRNRRNRRRNQRTKQQQSNSNIKQQKSNTKQQKSNTTKQNNTGGDMGLYGYGYGDDYYSEDYWDRQRNLSRRSVVNKAGGISHNTDSITKHSIINGFKEAWKTRRKTAVCKKPTYASSIRYTACKITPIMTDLPGSRDQLLQCAGAVEKQLTSRRYYDDDIIVVTEKLDGVTVGVVQKNGELIPVDSSGYHAAISPHVNMRLFAWWIAKNRDKFTFLLNGELLIGEWLGQAIGTTYRINEQYQPFVVTDYKDSHNISFSWNVIKTHVMPDLQVAPTIHNAPDSCSIKTALDILGPFGLHNAIDKCEGAVWRLERANRVILKARYTHPSKIKQLYVPVKNTDRVRWNFNPFSDGSYTNTEADDEVIDQDDSIINVELTDQDIQESYDNGDYDFSKFDRTTPTNDILSIFHPIP